MSSTGTRNYAIVTAAYWGFTLTDGALRMLVLLHFFRLGYSPFTLALLFLLYEAAGIGANLVGGWLATRFGIARMLAVGLATQVTGFLLLSATLILGLFFGSELYGAKAALKWDHKTAFSLLSWLTFALLLFGRSRFGWRGKRAVRMLYAGSGLLLLAYAGSRFVMEIILSRSP
jgi:hypothetical protein